VNPRGLSPHARSAVSVLRRGLGRKPLEDAPAPGRNEDEILAWLTFTGLGPAYQRSLDRVPNAGHTPEFLRSLEALRNGARARNMVHFAELARIHRASSERGIEFVPMKGVVAIARLYGGDISMRAMADLDLLVKPGDHPAFLGLLEGLGYVRGAMPIDPFVGDRGRHLPPMFHPKRRGAVEVHRGADYRFRGMGQVLMPDFFRTARKHRVDGLELLLPSWTAWLFQWAVHVAYVDAFVGKMRDVYDLAVLLAGHADEVDWEEVVHPKRTHYLLRPLWMGVRLAESIFGVGASEPWAGQLTRLAGLPYPLREPAEWFIRKSLIESRLHERVPVSLMAASSMPLLVPGWTPRFLGEFLRVFVAPPVHELSRQYGLRPGSWRTPLLYAMRAGHLSSILVNRIAGKWIGTRARRSGS